MTTTVALLLHRRRVTSRARRDVPRVAPPMGIVVTYTKVLRDLSDAMDHAILSALRDAGIVRMDDALPDELFRRIERELERVWGRRSLVGMLDHLAEMTSERSGREFRQQVQKALGVNLVSDPALAPLFSRFRRENLDLIKSLAQDKVDRVRKLLTETPSGDRVEMLRKDFQNATGATRSRAALIARDQVLKLNSQVTEERHKAAGITQFRWSTSRDERVRASHRVMDGKIFPYADPPIVDGKPTVPGQAIQCRCVAIPVLPT